MANKMVSKQTMTVGIIAIAAGLIAAYAVRSFLAQEEAPPPAKPPAIPVMKVPVAVTDLPANRVVTGTDMTALQMTRQQFDQRFNGVDPLQTILSPAGILHRRLKKPIKEGQPFLSGDFYLEGDYPSIAGRLQPGFRAIRVQVPDNREGGVQPGVFVDVLFRSHARKAELGQPAIPEMTKTLLQHIEVLETDRPPPVRGGGTKGEPALATDKKSVLVTLAVPEDQADIFGVVEGRGELWLVPTPAGASGKSAAALPRPLTLAGLLGIKPPIHHAPVPPPPPFETAIYRGTNLQINRFVDGKLLVSGRMVERGGRTAEGLNPAAADSPAAPADHRQTDHPQEE